jgi:glutamate/tyrosine decarboxylase-like PLP-dependent enzyme
VNGALFPSLDVRIDVDDRLTRALAEAGDRVTSGPVTPTLDMGVFHNELKDFTFTEPRPLDGVVQWTIAQLEHGLVHITHPRYFGLFNPTPTFPAQCADRIASMFNPQLATCTTSPTAVAIEEHVIHTIATQARLPSETKGHFTSGGSEANYTALVLALTRASAAYTEIGVRAFRGQPLFYVSRESHLAWIKIAVMAGLGRSAVRLVPTDGSGRMDAGALAALIRDDRAVGAVPIMVVATAGTTNAGRIDPLFACASIARDESVWYHIDAAWGGGLIASERFRHRLDGLASADSVTIDAHKWFATTMGCGMIFTRWPSLLAQAFAVSNSFMPSHDIGHDPYVSTTQWSRRFNGLRLFLSLAAAGWPGYAAHIDHTMAGAERLEQRLTSLGWVTVHEAETGVLSLLPPRNQSPREIVRRVLESRSAWVSVAQTEGCDVVRACVTSGLTSDEDIDHLADTLHNICHDIDYGEQRSG